MVEAPRGPGRRAGGTADRAPGVSGRISPFLVDVTRLAEHVVGGMHARDHPMLAEIFAYVEKSYAEPISLKEVDATVNLSPGYLTTVIKERTGPAPWWSGRRAAHSGRAKAARRDRRERGAHRRQRRVRRPHLLRP